MYKKIIIKIFITALRVQKVRVHVDDHVEIEIRNRAVGNHGVIQVSATISSY